MPRKTRVDINGGTTENQALLKEVYTDTFTVKNTSMNIMRNIAKTIDYDNKDEVLRILPVVQKQMDIITKANDTLLEVQKRLNG